MKLAAGLLAALCAQALARPAPAGHVLHEKRATSATHYQWSKRSVSDEFKVPVRVGLTQNNLDHGVDMLHDMSDPSSSRFGKHLAASEVAEMFAPSNDRIASVRDWLASSLPTSRPIRLSPSKQWLQFEASVADLSDLLHTKYHEYFNEETGERSIGCDEYHVPKHIKKHLDFITPGVNTLDFKPKRSTDSYKKRQEAGDVDPGVGKVHPIITYTDSGQFQTETESICGFAITPDCIRALYNVTDTLAGNSKNGIGIYETEREVYNQTDLDDYFKSFAPEIPVGTAPIFAPVDGAPPLSNSTYGSTEADLDLEASYPFVYPDAVTFFDVDDYYWQIHSHAGIFNTFLDAIDGSYCTYDAYGIQGDSPGVDPVYPDANPGGYNEPLQCGTYAPPPVISISYSADEDRVPLSYQLRQCNEWMKLGLQGISVVVSSGDSGVAPRGSACKLNGTEFGPQGPINCPYVAAVGGTTLPPGSVAGRDPETATTSFGSSGGFSNIFPQPAYQADAVNAYFTNSPPPYTYYNTTYNATHPDGRYNRGGRGYPDVSATGQNFAGFVNERSALIAGTSVSAPVFAALIARINSARFDAGKGALGFLNPTLYAHPEVFNDIVTGNNPGCGTRGFDAVKGWDPVTGLGTPNYGLLKEVLMGLP